MKVVWVGLVFVIAGDGFIESSEKPSMSGVSWVSGWSVGVLLGRVGNSSIVSSMIGCGVDCVGSVTVRIVGLLVLSSFVVGMS